MQPMTPNVLGSVRLSSLVVKSLVDVADSEKQVTYTCLELDSRLSCDITQV